MEGVETRDGKGAKSEKPHQKKVLVIKGKTAEQRHGDPIKRRIIRGGYESIKGDPRGVSSSGERKKIPPHRKAVPKRGKQKTRS